MSNIKIEIYIKKEKRGNFKKRNEKNYNNIREYKIIIKKRIIRRSRLFLMHKKATLEMNCDERW